MNTKTLQLYLIQLGYGELLRPYGADGKAGPKTKQAIKVFQFDYNKRYKSNIEVDGIQGPQTNRAINYCRGRAGKDGTVHFRVAEFKCKGSGQLPNGGMDNDLLLKLEQLRYNLGGKAIIINSGYRTAAHNRAVGGATYSQHLYGKAADIVVRGVSPATVYHAADKLFNGVGKYNTYTHVDTRSYKVRF